MRRPPPSSSKSSSFSPRPRPVRATARAVSLPFPNTNLQMDLEQNNSAPPLSRSLDSLKPCRTSTFVKLCCINEVCKDPADIAPHVKPTEGCAKSPSTFSNGVKLCARSGRRGDVQLQNRGGEREGRAFVHKVTPCSNAHCRGNERPRPTYPTPGRYPRTHKWT